MYCSIIKKTKITNNEKLLKFSLNKSKDLLSIGGTNGFVQILSYPTKKEQISIKDSLKFSYIDLNQKLIYHKSNVSIILWNEKKEKLTTCDEDGIIVIWHFRNDKWETQMINNRKKSIVSDIKWSKQGNFICFLYLDGHAILGSVEAERNGVKILITQYI
jgi:WD repeat-containing protein 35